MTYESLDKLYYKNEEVYKQTYNERFISEDTVKIDFFLSNRPAFFVQCRDVYSTMYDILKLEKDIVVLSEKLPVIALQQYSRKCLIDEIVLSNNIEGVHSTRKEIGEVLARLEEQTNTRGGHKRFVGLVNKYSKLISGESIPLDTSQDVRNIYDEIVLDEVISEDKNNAPDGKIFRKEQTTILSAAGKVVHVGMTPESKIIESMEKALAFLNDESIEPLYRISLFHYLFEYIHPFYDGNGRTGRFILSYCISKLMAPLLAYRISETIRENLKEYYKAFETCNNPHNLGDLTPFLIMMLDMIRKSASELQESLSNRLYSWNYYREIIGRKIGYKSDTHNAFYSILIQAALFSEQGITMKELEENIKASSVTIKNNYLADARANGLLIETKAGRRKYYYIDTKKLDDLAAPKAEIN